MTDLEISKALAIAIGWEEWQLEVTPFAVKCLTENWWTRTFDYRDWAVIGPIAERYDCFPRLIRIGSSTGQWGASVYESEWVGRKADTPQKAIALAVIGAKK